MKSAISLKQLQALEQVVTLGSFTDAAKALGVSQPTVSNLVNALERHYRCKLLDRSGPEIRPTRLLEDVFSQVKAISALSDELDAILSAARDLDSGALNIGYSTYQLAIPFLASFVTGYPKVRVNARAMATHDLLPLMRSGALELGFITTKELPDGFEGIVVAPARVGLVMPADHPLAAKPALRWPDLKGVALLQREPTSGTRRVFEASAKVANVQLNTVLGLGSWGSILLLVRSGVGIGVGFETEFTDEPGLVFRPIDDRNLHAFHFLACPRAIRQTSVVDRFFEVVARECNDSASAADS